MSVIYGECWHTLIKGKKEDLKKIIPLLEKLKIALLKKNKDKSAGVNLLKKLGMTEDYEIWNYECCWWNERNSQNIIDSFNHQIKNLCDDEDSRDHIVESTYYGCDGGHGCYGIIIRTICRNIPELAVAVKLIYEDHEYNSGEEASILYKPCGVLPDRFWEPFAILLESSDVIPTSEKNWIPWEWMHLDETPPFAKATGSIILKIPKKYRSEELETRFNDFFNQKGLFKRIIPFIKLFPETRLSIEDGIVEFSLISPIRFDHLFLDPGVTLNSYIRDHAESFEDFCNQLADRKGKILVKLDEYSGSNKLWDFPNHSYWEIKISAKNGKLYAKPIICKTYGFGSSSIPPELIAEYFFKLFNERTPEKDELYRIITELWLFEGKYALPDTEYSPGISYDEYESDEDREYDEECYDDIFPKELPRFYIGRLNKYLSVKRNRTKIQKLVTESQ